MTLAFLFISVCFLSFANGANDNFKGVAANAQPVFTLTDEASCDSRYLGKVFGIQAQSAVDKLHFFSAGSVCFARGLNDTPKIAALCCFSLHLPCAG